MQTAERRYPLTRLSCQYGAPMGRRDRLPEDVASPIRLHLYRLPMEDFDYDKGGAYWGGWSAAHGGMYRAVGERDGDESVTEVFVRAKTRAQAKQMIRELIPGATFYR